jgi:hypothetical protein
MIKLAKEIWIMDSYPYSLRYKENTANLFYNITGEPWAFKQSLLKCYASALTDQGINNIRLNNAYTGLRAGVELAESFTIVQKNVH